MAVLDPRTVENLAELVCDLGGPYERRVRELVRLFAGAGWSVEYGEGARVPWIVETIRSRNDDEAAIVALLARVVDPREYEGGLIDAEALVDPLNRLLEIDGFEVGHERGRSFARRQDDSDLDSTERIAAAMASPELRSKVRELTSNDAVAELLIQRLDEVDICRKNGAYLLAVVGTGAFIEGLLWEVLRKRDPETKKEKTSTLDALLVRAHKKYQWIEDDAHSFGLIVRDYRNLVHPRKQQEMDAHPDEDTVLLCWQPVLAMVNDLYRLVPRIPPRG